MALTKFKDGEFEHIVAQKEVFGFLVSSGNALDNPVFVYSDLWGDDEPADAPVLIQSLVGYVKPKYRYQRRELWQCKYDHMTNPKWGDAISASVILQEV